MRAIWITWERQRRNKSMAEALGADLHEFSSTGGRLSRYLTLSKQTLKLMSTTKPDVVFFQNPSLILAALIALSRKLFFRQIKIVGDYHNAGVYPPALSWLTRWIAKNSDVILVSNQNLVEVVESWGADAMAIPDPIPKIHDSPAETAQPKPARFVLLFICSWADDEPVAEVIDAAEQLSGAGAQVEIKITGRPKWELRCGSRPIPSNVTLTNFLSDEEFDRTLKHADAVMDLTTRDNCMVCGAYEAVAAERPMILSENEATKQYFYQGVAYTDNSAASIAACVLQMIDQYPAFSHEASELKSQLLARQKGFLGELSSRIGLPMLNSSITG